MTLRIGYFFFFFYSYSSPRYVVQLFRFLVMLCISKWPFLYSTYLDAS
uniref:Uncharacterized protein n=1 Tax=Arundo donax TaxID=35708 RepID=A0A0A9ALR2_ARUDO